MAAHALGFQTNASAWKSKSHSGAAVIREIEALGAKSVAIQADFANGKDAVDRLWEQFEAAAIAATGEPSLDSRVHSPRRRGVLDAQLDASCPLVVVGAKRACNMQVGTPRIQQQVAELRIGGPEGDPIKAGAVHGFERHLHVFLANQTRIAKPMGGNSKERL